MLEICECFKGYTNTKAKMNQSDVRPCPPTDSQVLQACVVLQSICLQDSQTVVVQVPARKEAKFAKHELTRHT